MMLLARKPNWLPLTVAVVALGLVSAEDAAAKCRPKLTWPGLVRGAPVIVIDGSIVGTGMLGGQGGQSASATEALNAVDPESIFSVEIICWNPETGEIQLGGGVNIIATWTKGFVESTGAPIEVLLRAQQAYFSHHSRYAQSLDDLVEFGVPRDAMLEFSATSTGWSATTPRDDVDYRCFVYSGSGALELASMKEHEVVCQPERAKLSRALREMYEGLVSG